MDTPVQRPFGQEGAQPPTPLVTRARLVFIAFAVIAAVLLLGEHRVHVLSFLPWLFLAACPLMHLFMHRGHSGNRSMCGEHGRANQRPAPGEVEAKGNKP